MREKLEKNDRMIKGQCDGEKKTDREIEGGGGGGGGGQTQLHSYYTIRVETCVST